MSNKEQIAFIICVNNEIYFEECAYYIDRLQIPEGYTTELLAIREADSMCAAYNLGMQSSEAKYKIYMHQDVFIRNPNFLQELLAIFKKDESVGMLGMMGGNGMPKTGVTYLAWDAGLVDCRDADMAYYLSGEPEYRSDITVEAVDGLLIATQYDVPWREDLFHDFDFYDVSQSFEMRKRGYHVVVPYQAEPWVIHDSSFAKLDHYDRNRKICMEEYAKYLYADDGVEFVSNPEWDMLSRELAGQIKRMLEQGNWEAASQTIAAYRQGGRKDSALEMLGLMTDIWEIECTNGIKPGFFAECENYPAIYEKYTRVRFLLRRMELGMPETEYGALLDAIEQGRISADALTVMVIHASVDKKTVLWRLERFYKKLGCKKCEERMHMLYEKVCHKNIPVTYTQKVQRKREAAEKA